MAWWFSASRISSIIEKRKRSPLTDVVMRVIHSSGNSAVRYPIVQYDGEIPVRPDAFGVFTFHQIRSGPQFGGTYTDFFGVFEIGNSRAPQYYCQFFQNGELIHTESFNDLPSGIDWNSMRKVRRQFTAREITNPARLEIAMELPEFNPDEVILNEEFPVVERSLTRRQLRRK